MTPWKLTTKLNEYNTDYVIKSFICVCENTDFITVSDNQKLEYICPICENDKFYDANSAWKNIDDFLSKNDDVTLLFNYYIDNAKDDELTSCCATSIPFEIDLLNKKIIFANKSRFTLTLSSEGILKESDASIYYKSIFSELHLRLTKYLNDNNYFNIPDSKGRNFNLDTVLLFLKNKHLMDFDFCYWNDIKSLIHKNINIEDALDYISNHRINESIKKIIYLNYKNQLKYNGVYHSFFIEVFCENIHNTDILIKLLELEFDYAENHIVDKDSLNYFINFLKINYMEDKIVTLFENYNFNTDNYLFQHTVEQYANNIESINNMFKIVPCELKVIQKEFDRCADKSISIKQKAKELIVANQLTKSLKQHAAICIEINTYKVKLPKNDLELWEWMEELHDYMTGDMDIYNGIQTDIYGFFQKDILQFAVEIKNKTIIQTTAIHSTLLTLEEKNILDEWFELYLQSIESIT